MTATRTFPVDDGIHGMNRLALCLNAAGLAGQWHFAAGTRFDQSSVDIGFDNAEDAELAWRGHKDGGSVRRALSGGLAPVAAVPQFG
jgi:hypothetical protein